MNKLKHTTVSTSSNNILYYVTQDESCNAPNYGIYAVSKKDSLDQVSINNRFFTENEAIQCCMWLADNDVYPVTICEVLEDLFSF